MLICDWQDEAAYTRLRELDGAAWAWEFLRRNPDYQREWLAFHQTWQALEAAYGRPPDRDFCAWQKDPRAWVAADECNGDCRIDSDKVLIECAFGARWGFHKFPPDPRDDGAVSKGHLSWRERESHSLLLEEGVRPDPLTQAALLFDLDMPLKQQLERARRELVVLQRYRQRQQGMAMRSVGLLADGWIEQLRALDAEAAGVDPLAHFAGELIAQAHAMRERGYLDLPAIPG